MADYDWGKSCCGMTVGHADDCFEHPIKGTMNRLAVKYRPLGLLWSWKHNAYLCRRGCGCVVFSPEDHIKNVCTSFDPVVG
jgi:hypothetical protein